MFGRLLGYFSPLWLELKPSDERGDRFQLGAIIVNLTGKGDASRLMDWPEAGMHTGLTIVERNLGEMRADEVMTGIAAGTAPAVALPLIPLMQGGGEPVNIAKWLELAGAEPDARRRGDYGGLALVLAEAGGCSDAWKGALKEWNVIQSAANEASRNAELVTSARSAAEVVNVELISYCQAFANFPNVLCNWSIQSATPTSSTHCSCTLPRAQTSTNGSKDRRTFQRAYRTI